MESYNLKTAATYINNLLLARGLLRDGKNIEFAHPSRGEGGKEATMAQIINLVHDLILKRDRDQEYRESTAETVRTLRSEQSRQLVSLEKLQTRNADLTRQLSLAQSQEHAARAALRTAESSARKLRAEMLRLKTTVDQVRTSCANDVRKRDIQIQRLKSHLTTQQRGNKTGLVGASITINPGVAGLGGSTSTLRADEPDMEDPGYSLRQETTEFLTQLSQSLSDENDSLIALVRSTLVTLRELQGMPEMAGQEDADQLSVIGEDEEDARQGMMHALPTSYEALASDTDAVLDNLKNLLTNPDFVSMEEVESREEEIHRLRAGWEKMEARLRESFRLMDSWRKRMTKGDTINLDEITRGLDYDTDMDTDGADDISVIAEEDENEFEEEEDASEHGDEAMEDGSSVFNGEDVEGEEVELPSSKTGLAVEQQALKETNGNASLSKSPRKVVFSASTPNTPSKSEDENTGTPELDMVDTEETYHPSSPAKALASEELVSRPIGEDERTPRHTRKRHSSPHSHPEERSPKLSMFDKLKAVQVEAEVAAARIQSSPVKSFRAGIGEEVAEEKRQRRTTRSPTKPLRIGGRPKRRKSTLTPAELENLLGC
ncbi:Afadin and alpha-actinin-binding-domain-containing protein [Boeremia exigua]|uniref:Afadin and alpha-actinin-binding-domain-containing protein n=1 Tax=Boeremia exigua TaxID=749465 RepID=UPI001E8CC5E5|nr:Afadin and alpha-actinin-binding-domain-containing protein [Boeremia exigua]KAH6643039.1 Afadin and alpha-actinin-binding-domain-containing protein [Boeremia exigua]